MFSNVQPAYHTFSHPFRDHDDLVHSLLPASPPLLPLKSSPSSSSYHHSSSSRLAGAFLQNFPPGLLLDRTDSPGSQSQDLDTVYHSDHHFECETFAKDIVMDSQLDAAALFDHPGRDAFSDVSGGMPVLERRRTGSSHKFESSGHHNGSSMDGSDGGSAVSSPGAGGHGSNEHAGSRAHDDGTEGDVSKGGKPQIPPWSELKTKAGKERKRLPLACIACRRKKIRCSGEKPACKHCLRSRIPCVYKVTTRKAAPRTDYMTMLDKRLKRMEERVIKIIPDTEPAKMASIGRSSIKPFPPTAPRSASTRKRPAEEAFGTEIDEWLQGAATAEFNHLASGDQNENKLLTEGADSLPPREIQEHLAETFFDYVYGQSYHLLHKPSFMRRLRAGTVPPVLTLALCAVSARFSTHPQVNTEPAFLRGEQWAKPARDIAMKRYDEPNITILTVLLILGLHEFGTCQGGRSWMLGGMAMRMAHALQLHRELDHDPLGRRQAKSTELSFTDREIRRRTMWACFVMDRFNSSGTERPMLAIEDNIEVQLPINESQYQMEIPGPTENLDGAVSNPVSPGNGQVSHPQDNMGVAAYLIRAIALWGRVIRYLNLGGRKKDPHPIWHPDSQFSELKNLVDRFQETLPPRLVFSAETLQNHAVEKLANQFLFMHIVIHQIALFLHKFAIPMKPGGLTNLPADMPKEFINKAGRIAIEAAGKISELVDKSIAHLVVAPFAGYCAFLSSTVHVWGIFSKNPQLEASSKRHLACNVKYLSRMKVYWGVLYHMADNLRTIYRQYADAALHGPAASTADVETGHDSNIFEYGGWFDAYPHGVSQTDYQEPALSENDAQADEAVLSQKSDLQTVEEFFNTLSPPQSTIFHQQRKMRTQSSSSQQQAQQYSGQFHGSIGHQGSPTGNNSNNNNMMGDSWPGRIQTHHLPSNVSENSPLVTISPSQQQQQQQQQQHQSPQHRFQQQQLIQSQQLQHRNSQSSLHYVQQVPQQQQQQQQQQHQSPPPPNRSSFDAAQAHAQAMVQQAAVARAAQLQQQQQQQQQQQSNPYNQIFSSNPSSSYNAGGGGGGSFDHSAGAAQSHVSVVSMMQAGHPQPLNTVHDIDRQLVFGAYASDTPVQMGSAGGPGGWDDFAMGGVVGGGGGDGSGSVGSGGGNGGNGGNGGSNHHHRSSSAGGGVGVDMQVNVSAAGDGGHSSAGGNNNGGGGSGAGQVSEGGNGGAGGNGGGGAGGAGGEAYADASSAWFMPFNLAPPDVGVDGGSGGFGVGGYVGDVSGGE